MTGYDDGDKLVLVSERVAERGECRLEGRAGNILHGWDEMRV